MGTDAEDGWEQLSYVSKPTLKQAGIEPKDYFDVNSNDCSYCFRSSAYKGSVLQKDSGLLKGKEDSLIHISLYYHKSWFIDSRTSFSSSLM